MHRLFVAIRPSGPVRALLCSAMGGVAGARWQDDDQLHLTLRFLGEIETRKADDIVSALYAVAAEPFALTIDGLGTFAKKDKVHTLWAGLEPSSPLEALRRRVDRAIGQVLLADRRAAYVPHITLARFSGRHPPTGLPMIAPWPKTTFQVTGFALFESGLSSTGASYSVVERYALS